MAGSLDVQSCSQCNLPAVIHQIYSGQHLCQPCLAKSIRKRVSKTLRNQLDLPSDARDESGNPSVILVCISGGKDSAVLLDMMVKIVGGDGEGNITLYHQAMKMASDLKFGTVEEMWFEGNLTTVVATIRGGSSLWLTSDVLPVGRLSHEARALRPIIEDLIEV